MYYPQMYDICSFYSSCLVLFFKKSVYVVVIIIFCSCVLSSIISQQVSYPSLKDEIKIGDYYLRILLEQENNTAQEESPIRKS